MCSHYQDDRIIRIMRSSTWKRLLAAVSLCVLTARTDASPAYITFPSDVDWVMRSSPHFSVIYRRGENAFAKRALVAAERAHELLTPMFPESPDHTWIVLADFQDSTNGYSLDLPYPHIVIFAAPPSPSGLLSQLDGWLDSVILHEYVHTLHLYPASGLWKAGRYVFGSWVLPNFLMPSHLHEGLATFLETKLTQGGRGRGAHFQMYRRKAVEAGVWGKDFAPLDLLEGSYSKWPLGSSPYFFGYYAYEGLWKMKGAQGIKELATSYSSNWPFLINVPFNEVYGSDYSTLWNKFYADTEVATKKEIEEIKKQPLSSLEYLTSSKFGKWDLAISPSGTRAAFRAGNPDEESQIKIIDLKTKEIVDGIKVEHGDSGLCWVSAGKTEKLIHVKLKHEYGHSINEVERYDLTSKEIETLSLTDDPLDHIHQLSCTPNSDRLMAYREVGGTGKVFEIKFPVNPKEKPKIIRSWNVPEGAWISSLVIAEPSWIVARTGMETVIYEWPRQSSPVKRARFPGHLFQLKQGKGQNELLGIWDRDGRFEVWSFDTKTWQPRKVVALTGGINSFGLSNEGLIVSSYEHGGYDIAKASPVTTQTARREKGRSARKTELSSYPEISEPREYWPWKTLYPRAWIPNLLFVPSGAQISAWVPGFDIAQRHFYDLYGGYDTRGAGYASFDYHYRFAKGSMINAYTFYSPSYFYASSGNTFLKQWGGSLEYLGPFSSSGPGFTIGTRFRRLEPSSLGPAKQSVGVGLSLAHSFWVKTHPKYDVIVRGTELGVSYTYYPKLLGSSDNYFTGVAELQQYAPAPWGGGHRAFLKARYGHTEGTSRINSYFEGGGEVIFSPGPGAFLNRGFQPASFYGRRMFNVSLEYRFPIVFIDRGFGLWPLFLKNIEGALVADTTTADWGLHTSTSVDFFKLFYTSAGFELKSQCKLTYYLPTILRMGIYHAFNGLGRGGQNVYVTFGALTLL